MEIDEDAFEARQAAVMDETLARMRKADPDLNRIFRVGFVQARDTGRTDELTAQIEQYARTTHEQGRLIDYHRLFAGRDH
ncbi:hypothetical protein ACFCX4_09025 [Kitasatospora sp. NPDC056327]|uniref:hypothetical protein n=1 Tax=Kitasatospora sp. NPDC056327 TaxID=3345785 RepID=UPI0035D9905F